MILGSNLNGTFFCTRAVIPRMKAQQYGKIINVSSGAGKRGSATRAAYSAAKHGVVGFGDAVQKDMKGAGITRHGGPARPDRHAAPALQRARTRTRTC